MSKFTAATWNVYHGTEVDELRPILKKLKADGVTLILGQECSDERVQEMFRDEGYHVTFGKPQFVIAVIPAVWIPISDSHTVQLSPTSFLSARGKERYSEAVVRRYQHQPSKKTIRVMSYHTPAHVQVRDPAWARVKAASESAKKWARMADRTLTDAILFGGDDNVWEQGHFTDGPLRFFRNRYTGLKQVQAPNPTLGKRWIDDFRVKGLEVGAGETRPGGGDHKIHVRTFGFK